LHVPIWLLGSSLFSAQLAAMLGLPFAFASHFAPEHMVQALHLYRERFEPSKELDRPYAMLALNVIAADTDAEALRLFTSQQQSFTNLRRGRPGQLPPPIDNIDDFWTPDERALSIQTLRYSHVGSAETIERGLREFIGAYRPDELMITGHIYDHDARLRSFEIAAQVRDRLADSKPLATLDAPGFTPWPAE
jgi:luciferase family oxidoreductase group 1